MASWAQIQSTPGRRVWRRRLGVTESCFYWDSVFNGTTDTVMHIHLRAVRGDDTQIHSYPNVHRAWSSVRRRFPLLAAEVREDGHDAHFLVCEENVMSLREDDLAFSTVSSFQDADQFVTDILDGPPPLSSKRLAKLYVLQRTDRPCHLHVVLVLAHCITDGSSTSTILRTLFQSLVSSYDPVPLPIPDRLQMCLSIESRLYFKGLSVPEQRWRKAIGYALHTVRLARFRGGHTIPANFTSLTPRTPAKSRIQLFSFPRALSNIIFTTFRHYNIPPTCVYYVLSQVVLSRMICRRYLRGDISEDEWEYRKREPMFFNGPLNLRPYLDQDWFMHGGSGEVGLNASFAQYVLPFLPLGTLGSGDRIQEIVDGAPDFSELMSFERFLHRCHIVRSQTERLFNHPLFLDICTAGYRFRLPFRQGAADAWRARDKVASNTEPEQFSNHIPVPSLRPIMTQDGSSMGNMDKMMPLTYPLPASHPLSPLSQVPHPHRAGYPVQPVPDEAVQEGETPRLHIEYWRTHMHLRPAELYLGSWTVQGQLQFFMFYDEHVFSSEVVKEWLCEFKEAVRWYLCDCRGEVEEELGTETFKSKL